MNKQVTIDEHGVRRMMPLPDFDKMSERQLDDAIEAYHGAHQLDALHQALAVRDKRRQIPNAVIHPYAG